MIKPVILYDFDGVINPLNFHREKVNDAAPLSGADVQLGEKDGWRVVRRVNVGDGLYPIDNTSKAYESSSNREYSIQWSSRLIEDINALIDEDVARHVMLTTWKEDSVKTVNPMMGLKIDEYIPSSLYTGERFYTGQYDIYQEGKEIALKLWLDEQYGEERPPVIWFDDVATKPALVNIEQIKKNLNVDQLFPFLIKAETGITVDDWARALKIVKDLTE